MPFRPLSHNERILVKRDMQTDSATSDEICEHLIYVFEKVAAFKDISAYELYLEKEKKKKENPSVPFPTIDPNDPNFMKKLAEVIKPYQIQNPTKTSQWLFGDTSNLHAEDLRLRTLFFNSKRYRRTVLDFYIQEGFLTESDDVETIERVMRDFEKKYPGTRTGLISLYEIYFGDPSQFSYQNAKTRMTLFNDPQERQRVLEFYKLPWDWEIDQIKSYFLERGLESGSLQQSDLDTWEGKTWDY